jgi:hypothetical protein
LVAVLILTFCPGASFAGAAAFSLAGAFVDFVVDINLKKLYQSRSGMSMRIVYKGRATNLSIVKKQTEVCYNTLALDIYE